MDTLPDDYRALVIGASGAIGDAFVQALRADRRCAEVIGLSRSSSPALDLRQPASIAAAAAVLADGAPFALIVQAAGVLHTDGYTPEKNLAALNQQQLMDTFQVNTIGPALVLQQFVPLLHPQGLMALLSAKVGSIGDNRLGGWYSYRASKAALNMLVKTAAIELARTRPAARLLALHPGTVASALSQPFRSTARAPLQAVAQMLAALDGVPASASGSFISYQGEYLPW